VKSACMRWHLSSLTSHLAGLFAASHLPLAGAFGESNLVQYWLDLCLSPLPISQRCSIPVPRLLHTCITIEPGNRLVIGQKIWYSSKKSELKRMKSKGAPGVFRPAPDAPKQRGPASSASNTSTSIAGVAGEVSRQQVASFCPVASQCCLGAAGSRGRQGGLRCRGTPIMSATMPLDR
jgi:hypothetical protein